MMDLLKRFALSETSIVVKVQTSIPRDCLQAERSLLLYCKFSGLLALISMSVLVDFSVRGESRSKLITSNKFSITLSVLFFVLSIGALTLGVYNYFTTVYMVINNRGPRWKNNSYTSVFLGLTVVSLLAVNIVLMIGINE